MNTHHNKIFIKFSRENGIDSAKALGFMCPKASQNTSVKLQSPAKKSNLLSVLNDAKC
jgi:hypothetical protein